MKVHSLRRNGLVLLGAFLGSCALPSTPDHALPGGGAPLSPALKRDKVPPASAGAPSRDLDIVESNGGRQTLVEMYTQKVRQLEELGSSLRAKDQRVAAMESSNTELVAQNEELKQAAQKERSLREKLEQEIRSIQESLFAAAIKQAETEKELLQLRIAMKKSGKKEEKKEESHK